ncbi:MAG: DUF937 domain-containing protein [Polyangiales bacterium]
MAIHLVDTVSRQLTPDLIGKMSTVVGESPSTVTRASSRGLPAIVGAVVQRGSTEQGARGLIDTIHAGAYDSITGPSFDSMLEREDTRNSLVDRGRSLLSSLFGPRLDGTIADVGSGLGLSSRASEGILAMLAPLVMSVIGRHVREYDLSPSELSGLLREEASVVTTPPARVARRHAPEGKGWVWGVLGVAALALGGGIFLCNRSKTETSSVTQPTPPNLETPYVGPTEKPSMEAPPIGGGPPAMPAPAEPTAPKTEAPKMEAPKTEAPKMEAPKMKTPKMEAPKKAPQASTKAGGERSVPERFVMPGLSYDTGTTNLTLDDGTIDRVAKTLDRNPNRYVLIEGFTDDTGSNETNRQLSQARAEAVKKSLVDRGIEPNRIETVGFGAKYPVGDNKTEAGRAKNRRVEFVVTDR